MISVIKQIEKESDLNRTALIENMKSNDQTMTADKDERSIQYMILLFHVNNISFLQMNEKWQVYRWLT